MTDTATPIVRTDLPLSVPVTSPDGITYEHLSVRRPKARDVLNAGKSSTDEAETEVTLFSWLAGVQRDVILDLDLADYRAFQRLYAGFTKPSPKSTGEGKANT